MSVVAHEYQYGVLAQPEGIQFLHHLANQVIGGVDECGVGPAWLLEVGELGEVFLRRLLGIVRRVKGEIDEEGAFLVFLDEAQFLTKSQVFSLGEIVGRLDIPVLAYGLRSDFRGELFEGSLHLLAWADELVEIKTICHCGKKAGMVLRLDENGEPVNIGDQVKIGGNDIYVSVCRKHFNKKQAGYISDVRGTNLSS